MKCCFRRMVKVIKMSLLIVAETLLLDFYVNGCRKWVRV